MGQLLVCIVVLGLGASVAGTPHANCWFVLLQVKIP